MKKLERKEKTGREGRRTPANETKKFRISYAWQKKKKIGK